MYAGRGSRATVRFKKCRLSCIAILNSKRSKNQQFSKHSFGREGGVTKKECYVYALDNVDNSGLPLRLQIFKNDNISDREPMDTHHTTRAPRVVILRATRHPEVVCNFRVAVRFVGCPSPFSFILPRFDRQPTVSPSVPHGFRLKIRIQLPRRIRVSTVNPSPVQK